RRAAAVDAPCALCGADAGRYHHADAVRVDGFDRVQTGHRVEQAPGAVAARKPDLRRKPARDVRPVSEFQSLYVKLRHCDHRPDARTVSHQLAGGVWLRPVQVSGAECRVRDVPGPADGAVPGDSDPGVYPDPAAWLVEFVSRADRAGHV